MIIVGAGLTGLSLACQLIRYNVNFVILDERETTTEYSKAIGVQARSLEIYEQIGLADDLISEGAIAERAGMIVGGEVRGEIEFAEFAAGLSPYPYGLLVEHSFLSRNDSDFSVKAGDRMPYFSIDGASVYDQLRQPKFHLITFFDGQNKPSDFAMELGEYTDFIDFHTFPLYPNITEIFGAVESFNVFLRPDNYIGFISEDISAKRLKKYLLEHFE